MKRKRYGLIVILTVTLFSMKLIAQEEGNLQPVPEQEDNEQYGSDEPINVQPAEVQTTNNQVLQNNQINQPVNSSDTTVENQTNQPINLEQQPQRAVIEKNVEVQPTKNEEKRIELGLEVFLNYNLTLFPESSDYVNSFNIARSYVNLKGVIAETEWMKLKFRVTTDIAELAGIGSSGEYEVETDDTSTVDVDSNKANGYYMSFLKYAYLEIADFLIPSLTIRFGQSPVPWVGFEENISKMRWWAPVFPDIEKKLSSTDRGISLMYSFPRGFGDIHLSIVNGEGYRSGDFTKYKDFMGRISIAPFAMFDFWKGLKFSFYYGYGQPDADSVRNRLIGAVSYEHEYLSLMFEYLRTWDGDSDAQTIGHGFGGFLVFHIGEIFETDDFGIFARAEYFDTDTDITDNSHTRIIAGLFYELYKGISLGAGYQHVIYQEQGKNSEGSLSLYGLIKY